MDNTFEIESKAWVDDPESLRVKIRERFSYRETCVKEDTYYYFPGRKDTFRVRRQGDETIVTLKKKSKEGGIEVNLEREFNVSSFENFTRFIEEFNCPVFVTKRKTSEVYTAGQVTVELSYVDSLGWFVEVEQLVDSEDSGEHEAAKNTVTSVLLELGVPREKIESRYYTELLTGMGK